jgi:RNA polymerase sigma-70 factor (ECF subfamily)
MGPLGRAYGAAEVDEERLAAAIAAAARAWPDVAVAPEEVAAALGARAARGAPSDEAAVEVHLALGCARGDGAALAHFERRYLDAVGPALASMRLPAATVDDVRQEVRRRLLVSEDGAPPRLSAYAGDGSLRGLCGVVAVRVALSLLRRERRTGDEDDLLDLPDADPDPRLALMKAEYRAAFRAAFEEAVKQLGARDRNLLRLHHLDAVTLDQLAAMYGVHRATAVRWLGEVRRRLLEGTRRGLRSSLGVNEGELDSVMALIESRLDVSVRRLLASREGGPGGGSTPPAPG